MAHRVYLLLVLLVSAGQGWAQQSSLCRSPEQSVFWCETKSRRFELCASDDLGPAAGYMQYRAGSGGKADFRFPEALEQPKGNFELVLVARGTVLVFRNGQVTYEINQPLAGSASIVVTREGRPGDGIPCRRDSDTLTLTSTIDRFKALGIFR
jgi:hypothetical protein